MFLEDGQGHDKKNKEKQKHFTIHLRALPVLESQYNHDRISITPIGMLWLRFLNVIGLHATLVC
jgi:hypothetical protein